MGFGSASVEPSCFVAIVLASVNVKWVAVSLIGLLAPFFLSCLPQSSSFWEFRNLLHYIYIFITW